jgi:hypothetical protein
VVLALIGILSVYLGYRLFCGIAEQRTGKPSLLITNLASGALLALFGIGILVAGLRGYGDTAPAVHPQWQKKSAHHGPFGLEKIVKPPNAVERTV